MSRIHAGAAEVTLRVRGGVQKRRKVSKVQENSQTRITTRNHQHTSNTNSASSAAKLRTEDPNQTKGKGAVNNNARIKAQNSSNVSGCTIPNECACWKLRPACHTEIPFPALANDAYISVIPTGADNTVVFWVFSLQLPRSLLSQAPGGEFSPRM